MKLTFLTIFLFFLNHTFSFSDNFKFEKIAELNDPWGSSFISDNEIIVTEKSGKIKIINTLKKEIVEVEHNLNFLEYGQGGLLDIIYQNNTVWISYTCLLYTSPSPRDLG